MTQNEALSLLKDAIWLILKLAAPLLIVSIVIGLIISIFQAATQIHEQTLTFVPKIVAIALLLIILGSWMLSGMTDFFQSLMNYAAGL
ncbi:MAG: flagellar biosynthesis protein FliQ [Oscillospiraceae bacterium]|jgi:flagellar biosynthetic protein FliQ